VRRRNEACIGRGSGGKKLCKACKVYGICACLCACLVGVSQNGSGLILGLQGQRESTKKARGEAQKAEVMDRFWIVVYIALLLHCLTELIAWA